jgi:catechol 2,3-dioxygenase-like lactoylglutathione lyase family enzyme
MIRTHGLNHISLSVRDPDVSLAFYERLFGVREYHREADSIQVLGPGPHDVLVFERREGPGVRGGVDHFGFRLTDPNDIHDAIAQAEAAGARILRHGEFAPGLPYLYLEDPDGYTIEVWYE